MCEFRPSYILRILRVNANSAYVLSSECWAEVIELDGATELSQKQFSSIIQLDTGLVIDGSKLNFEQPDSDENYEKKKKGAHTIYLPFASWINKLTALLEFAIDLSRSHQY